MKNIFTAFSIALVIAVLGWVLVVGPKMESDRIDRVIAQSNAAQADIKANLDRDFKCHEASQTALQWTKTHPRATYSQARAHAKPVADACGLTLEKVMGQ